jgi:hypothetical protein
VACALQFKQYMKDVIELGQYMQYKRQYKQYIQKLWQYRQYMQILQGVPHVRTCTKMAAHAKAHWTSKASMCTTA